MKRAIDNVINETIEEEIADYFAANLLVPTERFMLWEDKTDKEIARIFRVTKKCIKKRREEEIENELYFISLPKEHILNRKLEIHRGSIVGIGKVKIPIIPIFNYNIRWLSFLDIQESENSFVSTCIDLRIDGYGNTKEEAEYEMFEGIIYFLCQNFGKLESNYAWENIYDLYKTDDWSKELWDVYREAQVQLVNKVVLEEQMNVTKTAVIDKKSVELYDGFMDRLRKIEENLFVHKTYFKVIA